MIGVGDHVHVSLYDRRVMTTFGWTKTYKWSGDTARVLAIAEGYAMVRFRQCKPCVVGLGEIALSNTATVQEE